MSELGRRLLKDLFKATSTACGPNESCGQPKACVPGTFYTGGFCRNGPQTQ